MFICGHCWLLIYTYINCCNDNHVGTIELQPHLLNSSPELPTAFWTFPIHLHDIQPSWEHLGLTLDSVTAHMHRKLYNSTTAILKVTMLDFTEVRMTPLQLLSISSFSTAMHNSVRKSKLRVLTGGFCMLIRATPTDRQRRQSVL